MRSRLVGGAVPLLRASVIKDPETAKVLGGKGIGSNKIVGIYSPAPSRSQISAETAKPTPTVFQGGDLLKNLQFAKKKGASEDQNIKFLF
jgi:hypothetical protein